MSPAWNVLIGLTSCTGAYVGAMEAMRAQSNPAHVIGMTRRLQASRMHDNVFALYGILTRLGLHLPPPDYSKSPELVFWEYFSRMLAQPCHARGCLEQLTGLRKLPAVTSWTPDWSIRNHPSPMVSRYPSRQRACDVKLADNDRHLTVKGVVTDVILNRAELSFANTESPVESEMNERPDDHFWKSCLDTFPHLSWEILLLWNVRIWKTLIRYTLEGAPSELDENVGALIGAVTSRRTVPFDSDILICLFKILSGDTSPIDIDDKEQPRDLQYALQGFKNNGAMTECPRLFELEEWTVLERISSNGRLSTLFIILTSSCRYQTLFRTTSGRLGMAPYTVKEGDQIFMYVGSESPAVIRSTGANCHQWIASAYVRGAMEHDVFPDDEAGLRYYTFE